MNRTAKSLLACSAAALMGASAAQAAPITVGFEDLPTNAPATMTSSGPLTFTLSSDTSFPIGFLTPCPNDEHACNGDSDLNPASPANGVEGKILIIQEQGSDLPDDGAIGGNVTLTYTMGPENISFTAFSAVDDGTFTAFLNNAELGSITNANENQTGRVTFDPVTVSLGDQIRLNYSGSGGFDSLAFITPADVPAPAALPLFGAGLGLLGFAARRRKAR